MIRAQVSSRKSIHLCGLLDVGKGKRRGRCVKAAFESDKARDQGKNDSAQGQKHLPSLSLEECELLPVHHPGNFPLHGMLSLLDVVDIS